MSLEKVAAVSGLPGLYKVVGNRSNGLIIEDLDSGKRRFASARKHQFSPLETISIYTYTDSVPLDEVFQRIKKNLDAMPEPTASDDVLRSYFKEIIPDHDEYKVYPRDMKKVLKWYGFLSDRNLLVAKKSEEEE